jgi:regulatory protein
MKLLAQLQLLDYPLRKNNLSPNNYSAHNFEICSLNELDQTDFPDHEIVQKLRNKAFQLLARREYSQHELRQKFKHLAPDSICEEFLIELVEQGAQSDSRFADMLCRSRFNGGKGPVKLNHELNQHQIDLLVIEQAMSKYADRWSMSAETVRTRKFGEKRPKNYTEWAKQAKFLQQRGFTIEHIGQFSDV